MRVGVRKDVGERESWRMRRATGEMPEAQAAGHEELDGYRPGARGRSQQQLQSDWREARGRVVSRESGVC